MASVLFHKHLLGYLENFHEVDTLRKREMATGALEMFGDFIYHLSVPDAWRLRDMERIDHHTLIFHWISTSDHAHCPECKEDSHHRNKIYLTRRIQDLPLSGMTVYHDIRGNQSYAAAAIKCGKNQVADGTHLVQICMRPSKQRSFRK